MEDKQPQVKTGHAVQQLSPAQHDGEISNQLGNSTSLPVYRHQEPHEEQIGVKEQPLSRAAAIFALAVLVPVSGAVFAVMAVNQSAIANDQSQVANQIALLSMCYTNSVSLSTLCLVYKGLPRLIRYSRRLSAPGYLARLMTLLRNWPRSYTRENLTAIVLMFWKAKGVSRSY
jgi:hypothetical protein